MLFPMSARPKIEQVLLSLAEALRLIELPTVKKSNTEQALLSLAVERSEQDDPIRTKSMTLRFKTLPAALNPRTLTADPTRMNARILILEPALEKLKTLQDEPVLSPARNEIEDPMCTCCKMEVSP